MSSTQSCSGRASGSLVFALDDQIGQPGVVTGQPEQSDAPSPKLVAAWMSLDVLLDPARVPMWAAQWLASGLDTTAVRDLAGLDGRDPFAVRELILKSLDELRVEVSDLHEAARLVLTDEAEQCLEGRTSERELAAALDDLYVRSGHADEILRQPLGAEHGLDDEWVGGWGRTEDQLRNAVRSACLQQVAHRA